MSDDTQQERTEQATEKRRDDFRKKGQVAQSREFHTAALFSAALLLWFFYAPYFWSRIESLVSATWRHAGTRSASPGEVMDLMLRLFAEVSLLLAPVVLILLLAGILSSFLQVGPLLTFKPLAPDFSKLNVIKGAGRFLSRRSLVELVKSLAKVLLVGLVAFQTVRGEFDRSLILVDMPVMESVRFLGDVFFLVLLKSCGVLTVLAVFDYFFVRWEMEEKMKMTHQEQKEEFKETEGDPHLKSRIRTIQQKAARSRMMAEVPKADVVITNPTHISVALAYDRDAMAAPKVVAKGADHLAMRIREIARENEVPLVENKPVARTLFKVKEGESVPEEMFMAVAEILAYVYGLKRR